MPISPSGHFVIPAKAGIQSDSGFLVKPGMTSLMLDARCHVSRERKHRQESRKVLMKLTDRAKWGIATVAIPILAAALLYVYAILPEKEDIPPATGEVREIAPSWVDRALSAYYERKTDEPIVAIIRQEYPAQTGPSRPTGSISPPGGASSATRRSRALRKNASSGSSRSIPETCLPSPSAPTADTWQRAGASWCTCPTTSRSISGMPIAAS